MNEEDILKPKKEFTIRGKHLLCILIDTVFLCFWVIIQYLVNLLVEKAKLHSIDEHVLMVFHFIFALSTLSVVVIFTCKDVVIIAIRAACDVIEEINKYKRKKKSKSKSQSKKNDNGKNKI
jgi:hypothetical protein